MALISERFKRFEARRNKSEALSRAGQNDLTTTYKFKPDAVEALKLYKAEARKAGETPHDIMNRIDSKAVLDFAKKYKL